MRSLVRGGANVSPFFRFDGASAGQGPRRLRYKEKLPCAQAEESWAKRRPGHLCFCNGVAENVHGSAQDIGGMPGATEECGIFHLKLASGFPRCWVRNLRGGVREGPSGNAPDAGVRARRYWRE